MLCRAVESCSSSPLPVWRSSIDDGIPAEESGLMAHDDLPDKGASSENILAGLSEDMCGLVDRAVTATLAAAGPIEGSDWMEIGKKRGVQRYVQKVGLMFKVAPVSLRHVY